MESQFVAPDAYRAYYETFVEGYRRNLDDAVKRGEISAGDADIELRGDAQVFVSAPGLTRAFG